MISIRKQTSRRGFPMSTIPQVAEVLHAVLGPVAQATGRAAGFVRRVRKLDGSAFVRMLVFGWLAEPDASLEELCQMGAAAGVRISAQGLDQRFGPAAASCLEGVLQSAVTQMLAVDPVAIPLLQRFQGVYIQDSTLIRLPDTLAEIWPGCSGRGPGLESALKVQVRLDLSTGSLNGPFLQAGYVHDRVGLSCPPELPLGALRLNDLGYLDLDLLAQDSQQGRYWLSRVKAGTVVFDAEGERWHLAEMLQHQSSSEVDLPVQIGVRHRLPCRLLANQVRQEAADRQRMRLQDEARRRQRPVSRERLALANWHVFITNVPKNLLALTEALVLARTRWQIELLFKRWKSQGRLNHWRSQKPWRILCEVYAKLLAMLVAHWMSLVGCWSYPNRSLDKAKQTIQKHGLLLAIAFPCLPELIQVITSIQRCLAAGCRVNTRRTAPNSYQLLLNPTSGALS
jgi:hypothetical protein